MSGKKFWAFLAVYLVFQTARGDHNARPGSERRQDLSENVIVSQVAEALAKGLEESLKGKGIGVGERTEVGPEPRDF